MSAPALRGPHSLVVGPRDAVPDTPVRLPGSVRRTTSLDMSRPEDPYGVLVVDVRGRDLRTGDDGQAEVIDAIELRLEIDQRTASVTGISGPGSVGLDALVGVGAPSGFGRQLSACIPEEVVARTLRYSTLEDLAGALLVSGYELLHAGLIPQSIELVEERAAAQADICIGWADGGPVHVDMRTSGLAALPLGPTAPIIDDDDPDGWHEMAPLAPGSVRRRRRLDVTAALDDPDGMLVESHFRDSHAGPDGEKVMHEYVVAATIEGGVITDVAVEPRVLPWDACPGAVPSARAVVGIAIDDIAERVRAELAGPSTCTHLNSTLRCLADTCALTGWLAR